MRILVQAVELKKINEKENLRPYQNPYNDSMRKERQLQITTFFRREREEPEPPDRTFYYYRLYYYFHTLSLTKYFKIHPYALIQIHL